MLSRRFVASTITVVAILATGCNGDKGGETTATDVTSGTGAPTTTPETAVPGTDTSPVETVPKGTAPAWFAGDALSVVTDKELCPEPTGAPVHYHDDALVVFEPRADAAVALVPVLAALGVTVANAENNDPDGIQRLLVDPLPSVDVVHALQEAGVAIDFDYLHPLLPNYQPKPDDLPIPAEGDPTRGIESAGGTIAVVDVGVESWNGFMLRPTPFNVNPTTYVVPFSGPEFHNHGPFIADLVHRHALGANVELWPLEAARDPQTGTVTAGAIDEFSLLSTIAAATHRTLDGDEYVYPRDALEVLNLSLGGYGCSVYPHAPLAALLAENEAQTLYVAAAGNDGGTHYHFPAAFAAGSQLETEVANRPPSPRAAEVAAALASRPDSERAIVGKPGDPTTVDELINAVAPAMVSVGSATPEAEWPPALPTDKADENGDCFSNRGDWVIAWAPGAFQLSQLQFDQWFYWSGTSFAAPRFSAAVLAASGAAGMRPRAFWDTAESKDSGTYGAVDHQFIQFGLQPTKDYTSPGCV